MRLYLLTVVVVCLFASGCGKNNSPQPATDSPSSSAGQPAVIVDTINKGSLTGQVSPLHGSNLTLVASTLLANGQTVEYRTTIGSNGIFTFFGLPAGNYLLNSVKSAQYNFPEIKDIRILSGSPTNIGKITLIPNPDNGKIEGTTKPQGAAASVFVQSIESLNGLRIEVEPDPLTGDFAFTNLPPGKWTVWFAANKGFNAPVGLTQTISAKQSFNAGTFIFEKKPPVSNLSMKANGTTVSMEGSATYDQSILVLSGLRIRGSYESVGYRTYQLALKITDVTSPGTYICNETTTSKITYTKDGYRSIGGNDYGTYTSQLTGGSATVIITQIDPITKTIAGTFTAKLVPPFTSYKKNQEVTEGHFTAIYK